MSDETTSTANQEAVPAVKPEQSEASRADDQLQIKVTDNTTEVFFRVKRQTPLRRVIDGFCRRTGKDPKSLRFLYEGDRIADNDTPESLGMEDEDEIQALTQQVGGGFTPSSGHALT